VRLSFTKSNYGGTVILMAVILPLVVIMMAALVDLGRLYAVKSKAQNASDAALLGAVATLSSSQLSEEVTRLFNANYPANYMGSTVSTINSTQISSGVYEAVYTVTIPTTVTGIFSDNILTLQMLSQVTRGFDETINNRLELAMVLDNTGSMAGAKIAALKSASQDLSNILFGSAQTLNNLRISVVPYDVVVNIGTNRREWIQQTSQPKYDAMITQWGRGGGFNRFTDHLCGPYPYQHCWGDYWTSCTPGCWNNCNPETGNCNLSCWNCNGFVPQFVPAGCTTRYTESCTANGLIDASDEPPTAGDQWKFRMPYENRLNENGGSIYNAWVNNLAPMLFASNVKAEVDASFNAMQVSGATRINVGLMWGWFAISQKWQGLWDPAKPTSPQNPAPNLQKAVMLMTDGKNILSGDDARTASLCTAIKAQGIIIYTVGFGTDVNETLLRNCSTNPQYYWFAPDEEDLRRVFQAIADDLLFNTIRLSK
jgi:Flp pilus assembly protein TadG